MSLFYKLKIIVSLILFGILAGCSQGTYVANKKTSDPFTVYANQPLSIPPIYYLSSQEIADERRFIKESSDRVKSLLFENTITEQSSTDSQLSNSDQQFLSLADANRDLSGVREQIDKEILQLVSKDEEFINKIFSDYQGVSLDHQMSQYVEYNKE